VPSCTLGPAVAVSAVVVLPGPAVRCRLASSAGFLVMFALGRPAWRSMSTTFSSFGRLAPRRPAALLDQYKLQIRNGWRGFLERTRCGYAAERARSPAPAAPDLFASRRPPMFERGADASWTSPGPSGPGADGHWPWRPTGERSLLRLMTTRGGHRVRASSYRHHRRAARHGVSHGGPPRVRCRFDLPQPPCFPGVGSSPQVALALRTSAGHPANLRLFRRPLRAWGLGRYMSLPRPSRAPRRVASLSFTVLVAAVRRCSCRSPSHVALPAPRRRPSRDRACAAAGLQRGRWIARRRWAWIHAGRRAARHPDSGVAGPSLLPLRSAFAPNLISIPEPCPRRTWSGLTRFIAAPPPGVYPDRAEDGRCWTCPWCSSREEALSSDVTRIRVWAPALRAR
jgi:hypothetical protein